MKRIFVLMISALLAVGLFAGCAGGITGSGANGAGNNDAAAAESLGVPYDYVVTDMDGNVHHLSDYRGKPIYLKVWGTWCGVCVATLPSLKDLTAKAEDFAVLSVVPQISGELSREDLAAWLGEKGYQDIPVLYDENAQIVGDFDISGFPAQIMFDANGVPVYGAMGAMRDDDIIEMMAKIANDETPG